MRPLALLALAAACATASPAADLALAEKGQAKAVIVLGSGDPAAEAEGKDLSQLAQLLADHLAKMTGARFEIVREATLGEVTVANGRLAPAAPPAGKDAYLLLGNGPLAKKCGVTLEGLAPGGIVLKTLDNAVVIMGRGDQTNPGGNGYAVFQFLEALGCRSLWPGELGKVIPSKPTLTVPSLDVRFSPLIGQRNIRMMPHGPRRFDVGVARLGMTQDAYDAAFNEATQPMRAPGNWASWNRLGGSIGITGGHAGYGLKGGWDEHGKAHPEWFALQPDGTRDQSAAGGRWRACVSNPGFVAEVVKSVLEESDRNPQQRCFSLAPNDGGTANYCMCAECRKLDPPEAPKIPMRVFAKVGSPQASEVQSPSMTDRHVHFWNAVAEGVAKVKPDLLLSIDAYAEYATAPVREKLHPNLVLRYVPSSMEEWKGWQAAGAKKIFWRPNNLHSGYQSGVLSVRAGDFVRNARSFASNGMLATDVQGIYHNWATQGLNYYALARSFWNPGLAYEQILEDYCKSGFGPAAEPVRKYFLRAEAAFDASAPPPTAAGTPPERPPLQRPLAELTPAVLAELRGLLRDADAAAAADELVRKRVAFLSAGLEYTAATAELYQRSLQNPPRDPAAMAKRWASMRDLFEKFPLAVNVALVAGHDELLLRAYGDPGQPPPPATRSKKGGAGADWMFEDQTRTKK